MRGQDQINNYLPDELILDIFRRLESKSSRDACSLVCKRWLSLDRLNRTTLRINGYIPPDLFFTLHSRSFPHITSIHVDERRHLRRKPERNKSSSSSSMNAESFFLTDAGLTALVNGFPRVENLSLIGCPIVSSVGLCSFAQKCPSLKSLELQGCFVGDQGLAAVGKFCKQLEEVNLLSCKELTDAGVIDLIVGCGKTMKSIGFATLTKITGSSLEAVGAHCKILEVLFLDSVYIHDNGLIAVAQGSKNLKNLSLINCDDVTSQGLEAIAHGCMELTHLYINRCKSIDTHGLQAIGRSCMCLTELALLCCYDFGDSALHDIGKGCKSLEILKLVDCSVSDEALCMIAKGCCNLKKLHICVCDEIGNEGIITVIKHCKSLTDLVILGCDKVGDEALIEIGKGCSLQKLDVSGCNDISDAGISAIARGCRRLTDLSINALQKIGDMSLAELGEGCTMLKVLDLSYCSNITDTV